MKILPSTGTSLLALVLLASLVSRANSQDRFFNQTNFGDFALPANWQGSNPPSTGFANTFVGSSALGSPPLGTVTAYLNTDITSWETGRLFLGQGGSGNATLIISNGGNLQYGEVYIGRDAGAIGVLNQEGGTNRVNTGTFEIQSGGASGTYNLSGGVLNTVQAGPIAIKVGAFGAGTGYFNMSGGTFNAGSDPFTQEHSLNVGWSANGEATFSGGTANFTGDLNAGNGANGLVSISGSAEVNARDVNVGQQAGAANSQLAVSGGTLSVTNGISVANSSILNIGGGTVTASGIGIAAGSAMTDIGGTLNVPAVTNNGSLVFSNTAGTLTRTATISGGGTVTKTGAGSVTLTGANAYTGNTAVNEGLFAIDGDQSGATGALNVAAGATLAGSGTIGGAATINGLHSPGNSPGIQTFSAELTYATGATLVWELTGNTSTGRGTSFDGVDVTAGTLSVGSGVTSSLVFNGAGSSVDWSDAFWGGSQQWLVFDNASAPALSGGGVFETINVGVDSLSQSLTTVRSGSAFTWETIGNDVYLSYTIPEPSTYALLVLAASGLGAHVLRGRRR
jgi:fibronectin-binding autotransporter adhesin